MSHVSRFELDRIVGEEPAVRRGWLIAPLITIIATSVVILVMVAESRLPVEQRIGLFAASHPYP